MYTQKQTYPHHWNILSTTMYNQQYIQCNVFGWPHRNYNKQSTQPKNTTILGDFNIHTENCKDNDAVAFNNTMEAMEVEQYISRLTY